MSGAQAVAETQWKSLRALQVLLIPVCALTALWAKPVIELFYGAAYMRVFPVLLVLLASPLAVSMTDVSVASLYALERQRSLIVPLTFTAVLNILLAYVLVPRWGAVGAAAANSGAQLLEGAFLLMFSASVLATRVPWRSLATMYVVGAVSFVPGGAAAHAGWTLLMVSVLSVAGCFGFVALLVWTGELEINVLRKRWARTFAERGVQANA